MFSWTKIKAWVVVAAGGAVAMLLLLARVFSAGKRDAQVDSLEEGYKQEKEFNADIRKGRAAGDAVSSGGGVPIESDPNNRANRRKREG